MGFLFDRIHWHLTECISKILRNSKIPDSSKLSDIVPVYKKMNPQINLVYNQLTFLPLISKVFEQVIFDQLCNYISKFLNNLLRGFPKVNSTGHALFRLLQVWQKELDQCGFVGTILMYLSKAYDCLLHDLLIAKLKAYNVASLSLLKNYITNRKQRTKLDPLIVTASNSYVELPNALYRSISFQYL